MINKSKHRGIHKVWILQHLLITRLRWPLLIYEIPISLVVELERKISTHIRRWPRLHNSISNICLYSSLSPCPLPLKSLSSVLKSAKVSCHLLLRESKDPYVAEANVKLKTGNWDVSNAVSEAESHIDFKKILGYHQHHRAGFGSIETPDLPPKSSYDYRKHLATIVEELESEKDHAKAVQLSVQGQWTKWCDYVKFDLSWKTLLAMPQSLISFCLGATYDTLPSPANLQRWNIPSEVSCTLCDKQLCTTAQQGLFKGFNKDVSIADMTQYYLK